jgi:hypothetical protein
MTGPAKVSFEHRVADGVELRIGFARHNRLPLALRQIDRSRARRIGLAPRHGLFTLADEIKDML